MFLNNKKRLPNQINAGSMADIAFLLLIFFLVTTTIVMDKGILVKLPPWDPNPPTDIRGGRNILSVKINTANELLVEGELEKIEELKELTKEFIRNPEQKISLAESPQKAIISLQNDRGTSYQTYLSVYNELKAAYKEIRNDESLKLFAKNFDQINKSEKRKIYQNIPMIISEAEPTDYANVN